MTNVKLLSMLPPFRSPLQVVLDSLHRSADIALDMEIALDMDMDMEIALDMDMETMMIILDQAPNSL
jgi:hypothetical protein